MITHSYKLDMCPGGVPLAINLSQYDSDVQLVFELFASRGSFVIESGTTVAIRGTKPDGNGIDLDAAISDNVVTVSVTQQMTAVAGTSRYELTLYKGEKELNTANFRLIIERAALDKDTLISGSEIRELVDIIDRTDEIIQAAADIQQTAEDLQEYVDAKEAEISQITTDAEETAQEALDEVTNVKNDLRQFVMTPEETEADLYISDSSGNVIVEFADGHIQTKNFDSSEISTALAGKIDIQQNVADAGKALVVGQDGTVIPANVSIEVDDTLTQEGEAADAKATGDAIADIGVNVDNKLDAMPGIKTSSSSDADFLITDSSGNVIVQFADGNIQTKNFDSSRTEQGAVKTVNNTAPDSNGNVNVTAELDPTELQDAVDDYLTEHPVVASASGIVSVADYGAVGDGVTDDSVAIQNAVNSNYDVYFESNKTYFLGSTVTIDHDIKLHGGKNTIIKTATPVNAAPYNGIEIKGTLKTTTTLTTNYYAEGDSDSDNISNRFTLADMSNVAIGDILQIRATDQYFSYSRRYYYLGAVLAVTDIYDGHIYTNRNMPWDITLTNNVKVWVYSAPSVKIYDLEFVGDLNAFGSEYKSSYASLVYLGWCRDSEIKHCNFNHMKLALYMQYCVNTHIDQIQLSKSRYDNTEGMGDGYGIDVFSCTHTTIERVVACCSQGCVDMGGWEPCIDTFISKCDLSSECRSIGIDMHDNSYNMVIEDCVLGGLSLFGNARVNRCQFIRNVRGGGYGSITFRGFMDARWANLQVSNCTFPTNTSCAINFRPQQPQDYVQACDSIVGEVLIENCVGGTFVYDVSTSDFVLSNTINHVVIRNWKDCKEIYQKGGHIKSLEIYDSSFILPRYINKHTGTFSTAGIDNVIVKNTSISKDVLHVNSEGIMGGRYVLPEGIEINCSSNDSNTVYVTCGNNLASDDSSDYSVGSVSYTVGSAFTRTKDATTSGFLSDDGFGSLIYSVGSGYTTNRQIYPNALLYLNQNEDMILKASAVVKNTGGTNPTSFRMYIVIVDPETGNITYAGHGNYGEATVDGFVISHSRDIPKGYIAFWYIHTYSVVASSVTKIEQMMVSLSSYDNEVTSYEAYTGHKRTGDGVLLSVAGQNNIMSTAETFNIQFLCDFANEKWR